MLNCSLCYKQTIIRDRLVTCCICNLLYHTKCVGLGHCEFTNYSQSNDWFCINCCETLYPFNHLTDDSLFQLCANVNSLPDNASIDTIAPLNSNPFTLSKRNIVTGNDYDIDPDINFYDCLSPQKNNQYFVENEYISIINGSHTDATFLTILKYIIIKLEVFQKIHRS